MRLLFLAGESFADQKTLQIARELCSSASSFQDIIRGWIDEKRTAHFCAGTTSEGEPSVALVLSEGSLEIGQCEAEVKEVMKLFPKAVSFSDSIMPWSSKNNSNSKNSELLNKWFEERDLRLDATYHEGLCHDVASLDATTEMAISYALSGGDVWLSLIDEEWLSDEDDDYPDREGLISFGFEYMHPVTRCGWNEHCYAR